MTATAEQKTWDETYRHAAGCRWWPAEELVRAVARRQGGFLGRRMVEVGCGNGANLWFLAEHASRVVGLDFSPVALSAAREYMARRDLVRHYSDRVEHDVEFVRASAEAIPLANESVDALVDCMVSQHVPWAAHLSLYREYRRVLRPGGWLFLYHLTSLSTGQREQAGDAFDCTRYEMFPDVGLCCLPSQGALTRTVEHAGFRVGGRRGHAREYPDGCATHYAVIEGAAL